MDGKRFWGLLPAGGDRDVEADIKRQSHFDPDLWVIEVEDKGGRHLLDEDGLN